MDSYQKFTSRFPNFRSPLNLVPTLSTTELPPQSTSPTNPRSNQLSMVQARAQSESIQDKNNSTANPSGPSTQEEPDQWKSFQRFSRFKLEQMFPRKEQVPEEQQPGFFKMKSEQSTRSLSPEQGKVGRIVNQKLMNIEERLRKLNGYLKNEFMETQTKYFKMAEAMGVEAREKMFAFLKLDPPRTENTAPRSPEERKTRESDTMEESKEGIYKPDVIEGNEGVGTENKTVNLDQNTLETTNTGVERPGNTSVDPILHASPNRNDVEPEPHSPDLQVPSISLGGNNINAVYEEEIAEENANNNAEGANREEFPVDSNLESIAMREAHFRLRKALITFLSVFLSSMFLLLMIENGFTHRAFFIAIYGFFLYFLIEGLKKVRANEGIQWKRVENLFNTLDVTSALFFLAVVDLKLCGLLNTTNFITFIPFVSCSLYYFSSKAPKAVLETQAITRTLFAIQIFLITSKIDGNIDWPWKTVLCLLWGYLAMMTLYFVLLAFMMVLMVILSIFKISLYPNMNTRTQIIGFFWYLTYVGLGPLVFVVLAGVCEIFDHYQDKDMNFDFLATCLSFAKYYTIVTILLTQLSYSILIVFLQKFNIDEPEFRIQFGSSDSKNLTKIETEKRDTYLVMMSSTYFLPLKQSFLVKSKENLKRVKRAIVNRKNRGRKTTITAADAVKKRTKTKSEEPISIEALKKSKEDLTKKFRKVSINESTKKPAKREIGREKSSNDLVMLPFEREISKGEEPMKTGEANKEKAAVSLKYKWECFSEGDKDYLLNWEMLNEMEAHRGQKENENLCYICVERPPNAVVMNCGHGGICYECALKFAKKKNQCMECRGVIENVVKINPTPKVRNIIKGYETAKLIAMTPSEDE